MDLYLPHDLPSVGRTLRSRLLAGELAILPTDTIYGLSGNALDPRVVERILRLKGRSSPPAVIPHSLAWARLLVHDSEHAAFDEEIERWSGPYLSLWRFARGRARLPRALHSSGLIGLRLPSHWVRTLAAQACIPLVTTSVNRHLEPYMTGPDDLPAWIREEVGFMVSEGRLSGPPSTLVRFEDGVPRLQERN